jgi:glycosyltransferase involved in cell wall biosynthesis
VADDPGAFASACLRLLSDDASRRSIANYALLRAQSKLSWEAVSREFEAILENNRLVPNQAMPEARP